MVTKRVTLRAAAGLTLWVGVGAGAQAEPPPITAEKAVQIQPRQPGVNVNTPTPDQVPRCTVTPIPDSKNPKEAMGYLVRDPSGQPVRQFVSYDGKNYNVISFYVGDTEAYREVFPPEPKEPFSFRWLGPNGTKWGIDRNRDNKIDEWAIISPEELSQELLQAILNRDGRRAEALGFTKASADSLGLPAGEANPRLDKAAKIGERTLAAAEALKMPPDAKWQHIELKAPQTTPADALGKDARDDLVVHKDATVLLQSADGKEAKSFQIGEIVQVGRAWKLVDGPSAGVAMAAQGGPPITPEIRPLVEQLDKLDQAGPEQPVTAATVAAHNAKRAALLEQIVAKVPQDRNEAWTKMLLDALSAAAEGEKLENNRHLFRLKQFRDAFAKPGANQAIGSYAGFRYLVAENSLALASAESGKFEAVQEKWRSGLEAFIKEFPTSDEAPEAMLRLALALDHARDGEPKAKDWYGQLASKFPRHPHAAKAQGAVKRLESDGKPIEVAGPTLNDGKQYETNAVKGKVVVVYYCASWSQTLPGDAKKLRDLVKEYGDKVEVVTVWLDHDPKLANEAKTTHAIPGTHLHAPGGLDASPLAAQYGILVVPHLLVTDKDGKIVNRNAQTANLDDEVKKLVK
jgi:hypothetical protein